ncbi:MAG: DUF2835 domain-containing protein [Thiohalomonas sp.]|nr:DUF2835 domain-containing protein [Thiohalomonas sp.]
MQTVDGRIIEFPANALQKHISQSGISVVLDLYLMIITRWLVWNG